MLELTGKIRRQSVMGKREKLKPIYREYKNNGGIISPMNTETCRRYLQEKSGVTVETEDVL